MALTPERLAQVDSFETLAELFHEELRWPRKTWDKFPGVSKSYDLAPDDIPGVQSLAAVQKLSTDQQWGIFLVDFGPRKLRRSDLRNILNKVAEKARQKHDKPVWPSDSILFVCRSEGTTWTLGYYAGETTAQALLKTFGWNDPRSARTLLTRNLTSLEWDKQAEWHEAWDAEALTEAFYDDYDSVFATVLDATEHPYESDKKKLFVQSLFNRLMFLSFIEKMGWLTIDGERDYLFTLFQRHRKRPHRDTPTFYQVLELLFFSGLNSLNGVGGSHKLKPLLGDVPYLNGGLFYRDKEVEPISGVSIPDGVFEEILGEKNGLFRRYSFTVTESTPLDIDVAVDPEMLGKIFEELVTGRHETGSYYTPRNVVSFMCREALIGYLNQHGIEETKARRLVAEHEAEEITHGEITEILSLFARVRIVDPACGSGAYLLGMMRELFDLQIILERRQRPAKPKELYDWKLDIIQNNLYGVDLDKFAVNVARLRLWLSLTVDHKGESPEPLPNLDYKIETGDSLVAPNPTETSGQLDMFREERVRQFDLMKKEYGRPALSESDVRAKDALKVEIDSIRTEIRGWYASKTTSIVGGFDWRVEFAEVFQPIGLERPKSDYGFDIVVANPPYVRADAQFKHLSYDPMAQQSAIDRWREYRLELKKSKVFETLYDKWDLFIPFLERAQQVLAPGGQMVYIIADGYNANKYAKKSHEFFVSHTTIERVDFCSEIRLFKAGVFNTILHFMNKSAAPGHRPVRARRWGAVPSDFEANCQLLDSPMQEEARARIFHPAGTIGRSTFGDTLPLGQLMYISYGLRANSKSRSAKDKFITKDLVSSKPTAGPCVPYVEGKDLDRWVIRKTRYLEYGTARAPSKFARPTFPQLHNGRSKLIALVVADRPPVVADFEGHFTTHTSCVFVPWHRLAGVRNNSIKKTTKYRGEMGRSPSGTGQPREELELASKEFELLYILGILNSQFAFSWLSTNRRSKNHVYPDDWKPFPIRVERMEIQAPLVELVQKMLDAKTADRSGDYSSLQDEIDAYVDFLYNDERGSMTLEEWREYAASEKASEIASVRQLMKAGENETVEFKSSVIWNVRADRHDLVMRDEVLKEICAFLNADGGTILCGVDDDGNLLGLAKDLKHAGSKDKLGLVLANAYGDLLKPIPAGLVKMKFIEIDGETILRLDIQPDPTAMYQSPSTKKEDAGKNLPRTHVRIHGQAKALEGTDLTNWWDRRRQTGKPEEPPPYFPISSRDFEADPQIVKLKAEGWLMRASRNASVGVLNEGWQYVPWTTADGKIYRLCDAVPPERVYIMRRQEPAV